MHVDCPAVDHHPRLEESESARSLHGTQAHGKAPVNVPSMQVVSDPATLLPCVASSPPVTLNLPDGHVKHPELPALGAYLPLGHTVHDPSPPLLNWPDWHSLQVPAPVDEYAPDGQVPQLADPVCCAFLPAGQLVQLLGVSQLSS